MWAGERQCVHLSSYIAHTPAAFEGSAKGRRKESERQPTNNYISIWHKATNFRTYTMYYIKLEPWFRQLRREKWIITLELHLNCLKCGYETLHLLVLHLEFRIFLPLKFHLQTICSNTICYILFDISFLKIHGIGVGGKNQSLAKEIFNLFKLEMKFYCRLNGNAMLNWARTSAARSAGMESLPTMMIDVDFNFGFSNYRISHRAQTV